MTAIPIAIITAALAAVVGPIVTWRVIVTRQLASSVRQAWTREFREEVAALLSSHLGLTSASKRHTTGEPGKEKIIAEYNDKMSLSYYKIRLLIGERGKSDDRFCILADEFMKGIKSDKDIVNEAVVIIKEERRQSEGRW